MVYKIKNRSTASMILHEFEDHSRNFRYVLREIIQNILDYGKSGIITITSDDNIEINQSSGDFNKLQEQLEIAKNSPTCGKGFGLRSIMDHGYDISCSQINKQINIKLTRKSK